MKLKQLLIFLLGLFVMFSCQNAQKGTGSDAKTEQSGEGKDASNDTVMVRKDYHSNGNIWHIKNTLKVKVGENKYSWVLHGKMEEYYEMPKGCLASVTMYDHGKKEGISTKFYKNGKIYHETPYVHGKMDGVKKKFYENGVVMAETPYKQNFLGLGTQEYNKQGEPLTMPTLKVWVKDERRANGSYTVYAKGLTRTGKTLSRCEFFQGLLIDSKYSHPNLQPIKESKGIASVTFYESTGFPPFVNIVLKHTTGKGTPVLLSEFVQIQ